MRGRRQPDAAAIVQAKLALLEDLPKDDIIAAYLSAGGDEIASGKFGSPRSSAALAANAFGYFIGDRSRAEHLVWPARLVLPRKPQRVRLEAEMRFPWRGGEHPWLDVAVEAGDTLVGVEAKRFEPFRDEKSIEFSDAYDRPVWGDAMGPFLRVLSDLRSGHVAFVHLDACQLVKHALGLRTQASKRGRRPVLVYLYAEPAIDWAGLPLDPAAKSLHRDEVDRFARAITGAEVEFAALGYGELLAAWRAGGDADLAAHAERVASRYDL